MSYSIEKKGKKNEEGKKIINFPVDMDSDMLETMRMSKEELCADLESYDINPENIISDVILEFEAIENSNPKHKGYKLLSSFSDENKKTLDSTIDEFYFEKILPCREELHQGESLKTHILFDKNHLLPAIQFILASIFITLTIIANYLSIEKIFADGLTIFIITSYTISQLVIILIHKHLNNNSPDTRGIVKKYSITYSIYSCLNMVLLIVGTPNSGTYLSFITTILILLIAALTINVITVAISILCEATDVSSKEKDGKRYGKPGYKASETKFSPSRPASEEELNIDIKRYA